MPFIVSNFGTYEAYKAWNAGRDRNYILKLTHGTDTLIVKNNPFDITEMGLILERSPEYHGVIETATLSFSFMKNDDDGGNFLFDIFEDTGILSNVLADVYEENTSTKDFDIKFSFKIDFNTFKDEVKYITVNFIQVGLWQDFTSRDEIELDITQNTAIGGETVTDVTSAEINYKGIDIFLIGQSNAGGLGKSASYISNGTDYDYFDSGNNQVEMTGGRINFATPTDGKIYVNTSTENKDIKFEAIFDYLINTICDALNTITYRIRYRVCNSGGSEISNVILKTFNNSEEGNKTESDSIDYEGAYITCPVNGYGQFYTEVLHTGTGVCEVEDATFSGVSRFFKITERSNSFGTSTATSWNLYNAALKSVRLMTGVNASFKSTFLQSTYPNRVYITNGWNLRKFTGKGVNFKFLDLFKSASYGLGLMLGYDRSDNTVYIEDIEQAYQDVQVVDFGEVREFKEEVSGYWNKLNSGCIFDGKYEKEQGVYEFNISTDYSTIFKIPETKDQRILFHIDSLAFEFTRREQYSLTGATDTKMDNDIFMVMTFSGDTYENQYTPTGFDGIEKYYNAYFISRECIKRNSGILAGLFWKNSGTGKIIFNSNTKKINIQYTILGVTYDLIDDIPATELGVPFFYPMSQTFNTDLTTTQLTAIRNNPHGYYRCTDSENNIHYGYINTLKLGKFEKTADVEGLRANINR